MEVLRIKRKKKVKKVLLLGLLALALYNSVYFMPLDAFTKSKVDISFDAALAAKNFIETDVHNIEAFNASALISELETDFQNTLEEKGNKLGISKDFFFMIEDDAEVIGIIEENILVGLGDGSGKQVRIATDFVFGNAIREASGMFDIGDYQNTMDFNNISIELNEIVRNEIIPPFLENVEEGDQIYFKGAVKINEKSSNLNTIRVIPLILKIN